MTDKNHFGVLGIGAGPANLSLAALLYPHRDLPSLFLDRKEAFSWHDGQQIPGTTLQVPVLKDLVSLADPTSRFSFLNYLHDQGRIYHFVNARFDAVPRQEFRNYLEWASWRMKNIVFGEEVRSVDFDGVFRVRTDDRVLTADNIAVAVGSRPWIPPAGQGWNSPSQFHVCDFVDKAVGLGGKRVVVVGGGQSGAEAFLDLISREGGELPGRVSWFSRRRNFLPIDDSPFTNDFYMPCYSEYFYGLDGAARRRINQENVLSSDGISEPTLRAIYQRTYHHRFIARSPGLIRLYPNREITGVAGAGAEWELTVADNDRPGAPQHVTADVIIWATGFRTGPLDVLAPLADRLDRDSGEYRVDRDFAVRWDGPADRNIFIQNATPAQRGLADKNLSLLAWRSQRIVDRLRGVQREEQLSSFVEWADEAHQDGELRRRA
ncbi:L-lysine 6-monooxygenase [Streptomyces ipomoeae]|jgi:lysine N6-hydroxylase|uniref:L-lysine N6-monooxygenase MbtG n=2 Tax=Streptomyces ipomoeae TaxID=103232 RepID=L1KLA9_9ACTN|nr:SidA/IucD/PvdA family monooxygenase [Streptomyces ipomoeae]EKX61606.1 L-lysine 6-monooxygenase family protein [Streptomyces ipomoeae 91-03]MDX2693330.1 SidA/IucD/PvdA family monooxygenase [Streptomyces ipomoeae]MDX2820878.1 SidA/IucD/PvdA family monooxygenase [Streptomyces ipomoeae]MDX2838971.1 SidA/IucD/PvdA family monooxygenase [Streptomyces ipomoeae]MDX2873374.1 SidA/IucD/PvdA family monooxygenase [Streptomyces ipomoeae]